MESVFMAVAVTLYCIVVLGWTAYKKIQMQSQIRDAWAEFDDGHVRRVLMLALHRDYISQAYDPQSLVVAAKTLQRKAGISKDEEYQKALLRWADVLVQMAIALKRLEIYQGLVNTR